MSSSVTASQDASGSPKSATATAIWATVPGSGSTTAVIASAASSARYVPSPLARRLVAVRRTPPARLPTDQTVMRTPAAPGSPAVAANAGTSTHIAPMHVM